METKLISFDPHRGLCQSEENKHMWTHGKDGTIFIMYSHTFILFWLRKTSMGVGTYQSSFHVFTCASFFSKSFSFLFLFFCYPYICILRFHVAYTHPRAHMHAHIYIYIYIYVILPDLYVIQLLLVFIRKSLSFKNAYFKHLCIYT